MMSKVEIKTHPGECVGCLICQLACSFTYEKLFNPSAAHIKINRSGEGFEIAFAQECNKCGICSQYCVYGALEAIRGDEGTG